MPIMLMENLKITLDSKRELIFIIFNTIVFGSYFIYSLFAGGVIQQPIQMCFFGGVTFLDKRLVKIDIST